jgi:hypothetical protein
MKANYILGLFVLVVLSACSSIKYQANTQDEFMSFVNDWLSWEYGRYQYEGNKFEARATFLLSYDSEGYLHNCEIKEQEHKLTIEQNLCSTLKSIKYPNSAGKKIKLPVNFTLQ